MTSNLIHVGPQPKIRPILMLCIFGIFMTLFSGPAYNSNGFKMFLRESGFLNGSESAKLLLNQSLEIFQSMDVLFGAVVGLALDFIGPRFTHSTGYALFGLSLVLMMNFSTLWFAMMLQGCAAVFILNSAIHLSNLFQHGSNFVLSILSSTVEVGFILYPALALMTSWGASPKVLVITLMVVCGLAIVATLILFPDEPFFPRSEQANLSLKRASLSSSSEADVVSGNRADARDHWGDLESIIPSTAKTTIPVNEVTSLTSATGDDGKRRMSRMSVSYAAISKKDSIASSFDERDVAGKKFLTQLLSAEWIGITLVFSFFVVRANLYLIGSEDILIYNGDIDGRLVKQFAYLMPFSFICALLNGAFIEFLGVLPMACIINACGIGVNLLSMSQWLNVQKFTFLLFMFSRASSWNILFSYVVRFLGLRHFGCLTGITLMLCGIVNLTSESLIIRYIDVAGAEQWYWVNGCLCIGGFVIFVVLSILLFCEHRKKSKYSYT